MAVKRVVANIAMEHVGFARAFYGDLLGMTIVMDLGWILTFAGDGDVAPQLSVASQGGSGTPVPDISVEVDNFDEIYQRACACQVSIEYGPVDEPWGVRRFFVRDPAGRLVNILTHE